MMYTLSSYDSPSLMRRHCLWNFEMTGGQDVVIAIDCGTTSARAIAFGHKCTVVATCQQVRMTWSVMMHRNTPFISLSQDGQSIIHLNAGVP